MQTFLFLSVSASAHKLQILPIGSEATKDEPTKAAMSHSSDFPAISRHLCDVQLFHVYEHWSVRYKISKSDSSSNKFDLRYPQHHGTHGSLQGVLLNRLRSVLSRTTTYRSVHTQFTERRPTCATKPSRMRHVLSDGRGHEAMSATFIPARIQTSARGLVR